MEKINSFLRDITLIGCCISYKDYLTAIIGNSTLKMRIATITLEKHRPISYDKIVIEDIEGNNYEITDTDLEVLLEDLGVKEKEEVK